MSKSGRTRAATRATVREAPARATEGVEPDALWPIAMLRIAMEMRRPGAPGLDEIISGVVKKMGIPKGEIEKYISEHVGALQETARRNGYAR